MRTNGYKAHEELMHGKISYNSPGVQKVFHEWADLIGQLPVVKGAPLPPNPLLHQDSALLAKTPHFGQFYDPDNKSAMSKYGMKEFQRLLYDPKQVNVVIKRMAQEEARVYHTSHP